MKKTLNVKNKFYLQLIFLTSFAGIFSYGYQPVGKNVDTGAAYNQQPERRTLVLDGGWKFQMDIRDIGEKEGWFNEDCNKEIWADVKVPMAWNCYEDALWQYQGIGWYFIKINPEDFEVGKKVEINFGRVMYYSKLWLDGKFIGENIGGYLPFSFDITNDLKPGEENILVLRVDNRARIEWLPASEQIEWIQYGGILEPVKLVSKPHMCIDDLTITTIPEMNAKGARVTCEVIIANGKEEDCEVEVDINIFKNSEIAGKSIVVKCGPNRLNRATADFYLEGAELWSPETPNLYTAHIDLLKDGKKMDGFSDRACLWDYWTSAD